MPVQSTKRFLTATVLLLGFCGCQPAAPPGPKQPSTVKAPPAANAPTSPVIVELPQGWTPRKPTVATVRQMADYAALQAHFTLALQSRAQFNNDLMRWAEATKMATKQQTKLKGRTESVLHKRIIQGQTVIEFEIAGNAGGSSGIARVFMLSVGDWFCKLTCWTTPDHWNAAQPKFEELLGQLRTTRNARGGKGDAPPP